MTRLMSIDAHRARYAALSVGKDERTAAFDMVGGGDYELVGVIEKFLLDAYAPVPEGGLLVDVGCGPGRLARYLTDRSTLRYVGTDVVPEVLSIARKECQRPDWSFLDVNEFKIPVDDGAADTVAIFSVLTNILPEQAYLLVREAFRALRSGGKFLLTYLDIQCAAHQGTFRDLVEHQNRRIDPLVFLDRNFLDFFLTDVGFATPQYFTPDQSRIVFPPDTKLLDGRSLTGTFGLNQAMLVVQKN